MFRPSLLVGPRVRDLGKAIQAQAPTIAADGTVPPRRRKLSASISISKCGAQRCGPNLCRPPPRRRHRNDYPSGGPRRKALSDARSYPEGSGTVKAYVLRGDSMSAPSLSIPISSGKPLCFVAGSRMRTCAEASRTTRPRDSNEVR